MPGLVQANPGYHQWQVEVLCGGNNEVLEELKVHQETLLFCENAPPKKKKKNTQERK